MYLISGQFTAQAGSQETGQLLMPAGPGRAPRSCRQSGRFLNSGGFGDLPSMSVGAKEVAPIPWTRPGAEPCVT